MLSNFHKKLLAGFAATMSIFSASCGTDYGIDDPVADKNYCEKYQHLYETCCGNDADQKNECNSFDSRCCTFKTDNTTTENK